MNDLHQELDQFFQDNDRGYPRDPRRLAYKKLQKNIQGMDREQLEAFIKANLFIPHSQYKMALGNLIQFLKKQDQMNQLNEVKRFQKIAGLLKEDDYGVGTDYDESSDSESDDTDAMDGINEDGEKRTLEQREKIGEKLQYAVEDYLEDIGLREISNEERPKFQKGLGRTQTTVPDTFTNKVTIGLHSTAPDDDPRREDPRHNDQEVHYSLRIYNPNEKFNISTLRSFIKQTKREAASQGFRFFDTLRRSNRDILLSVTIR